MTVTSRFLLLIFAVSSLAFLSLAQFKEGIGYIGPACAVVEGNLYVHGLIIRALNSSEIAQFETYQDELEKLKKAPSSEQTSHPAIPSFCNDMSDSTEVILKGCIVRDNRVFIKGKLVRPLNSLERETVNKLLVARSPSYTPHTLLFERKKREATNETSETETSKQAISDVHNDVTNFLENILKVNSTVAQRFLPVAKMSPLLNELSEGAVKAAAAAKEDNKVEGGHLSEEQPFQHQLPQLHPLPNFQEPPFVSESTEQQHSNHFPAVPTFHSYPSQQNTNFENVPAMVNNEPMTSAFLINGNGQPIEIRGNIHPGDRIMMNGQTYVAMTMNQINPSQLGSLGNIFGNSQPQVQQPINTNYGAFVGPQAMSQTTPQFWQPNSFNPYQSSNAQPIISTSFGQQQPQNFASPPKIRYHPGKSTSSEQPSTPALTQADLNAGMSIINQMPHQICTAHIVNPFWFLEK